MVNFHINKALLSIYIIYKENKRIIIKDILNKYKGEYKS